MVWTRLRPMKRGRKPMNIKTYKRLSINLTEELDYYVLELRKRKEYVRCSYVEIIRVLMTEGAKALGVYPPSSDGKS